jgi:protease stability complex PrcB-like protein
VTRAAAALAILMLQASAPMRTIARGDQSGVDVERQVVARTAAEWAALWRQHAPGQPPPSVDFAKEMVVAVFLGSRNTAGYSVEIVSAETEQGSLIVRYRPRAPSPDAITAQIITTPFQVVAMPRATGDVKFQRVQ